MPFPSSTSSSEQTLQSWPRPSAACLVALATILLAGVCFALIGGGYWGEPPFPTHPGMAAGARWYNATTKSTRGEILLLGSSLMRYGVLEDQLAAELDEPSLRVVNLGLNGAGPFEVLRLLGRLRPRTMPGPKLAIVEVSRFSIRNDLPLSSYAHFKLNEREDRGQWPTLRSWAAYIPRRQSLLEWEQELRYGLLAETFPRLVGPPQPIERMIWTTNLGGAVRSQAEMTPEAMAARLAGRLGSADALYGLGLVVKELKQRGYATVLLQTVLHSRFFAALAQAPGEAEAEAEWRRRVLDPAATGADAVLVLRDAASVGADDAILLDFGHLTPPGAALQTRKVAEFLRASGLLAADQAVVKTQP